MYFNYTYIVVDLLKEYPIQRYNNITELDDDTTQYIANVLGVIRQYFKDNNIVGKPVKYYYLPEEDNILTEFTGQKGNTMGRFVVIIDRDDINWEKATIAEIKEFMKNYRGYKVYYAYNRSGYELSTKTNKEKKISKTQEELNNTYFIEDETKEYNIYKVKATSYRQAINLYFKAHKIKEMPCEMFKQRNEIEKKTGVYCPHEIRGRFRVSCAAIPRGGRYYNRKGYVTECDYWLSEKTEQDQGKEYTVEELLKKLSNEEPV